MSRRATLSIVMAILVISVVGGLLVDVPPDRVDQVFAALCKNPNGSCGGGDNTKTSALHVLHVEAYATPTPGAEAAVEPDTGESWNITAYWNTAGGGVGCKEHTETASVDVDWSGSSWALSNESTTTNIVDIDVCDTDEWCSDTDSYGYKLIVDITDPVSIPPHSYNLRQVVYTTTSVDDGYELEMEGCTLGNSVSPTSQTNSQTDSGPFTFASGRCLFGCGVSGATIYIYYE
jgi:hypothetical protein